MLKANNASNVKIEFTSNNSVKILSETSDGKQIKYLDFDEFCQCVLNAKLNEKEEKEKNDKIKAENLFIYPSNENISTIAYLTNEAKTKEIYILRKKQCYIDLKFHDDVFENVYIPQMLFAVKIFNNIIRRCYVCCVKSDIFSIDNNTKVYKFPYPNVYSDTSICYGGNSYSITVNNSNDILKQPGMFLAIPFTSHFDSECNKQKLPTRKLIKKIKKEGFNEEEILEELKYSNVQSWVEHISNYY